MLMFKNKKLEIYNKFYTPREVLERIDLLEPFDWSKCLSHESKRSRNQNLRPNTVPNC